jgi:IS5 family transposase
LQTQLGRVMRDIRRKIKDNTDLQAAFAPKMALAERVRAQRAKQRGQKFYSLHAPEVECIGKGEAHNPYEFGVKVSVATPIQRCKGGQFVAHVAALPGNPYDGHTLAKVVPEITQQIGVNLKRIIADAGYRGHNAPKGQGLSVFPSGQKRGVTEKIKRELRRRSAVEPVIGHLKSDHRMDRNHLKGRPGDAMNALLAAIGYNFSLLLAWITLLWAFINQLRFQSSKEKFARFLRSSRTTNPNDSGQPKTTLITHCCEHPDSRKRHDRSRQPADSVQNGSDGELAHHRFART